MTEMKKDLQYYRELPYSKRVEREHDEGEWETYYVATISELPGCMATGKTRQEAVCNLKNFFDEYIEGLLEWGEKVPEPKSSHHPKVLKKTGAPIHKIPIDVVLEHIETISGIDSLLRSELGGEVPSENLISGTPRSESRASAYFAYV